eukprot:11264765-Prorocentrum_lima.AAC.1
MGRRPGGGSASAAKCSQSWRGPGRRTAGSRAWSGRHPKSRNALASRTPCSSAADSASSERGW